MSRRRVNAAAMSAMAASGLGMYDDDVLIRGLHFPGSLRPGDRAAWSLDRHFAGMAATVGFLVVHVALALLVPSTLWAMLAGGPRLAPRPPAGGGRA